MDKPTVFISYSHKDEVWKNRLKPHLVMLEKAGRISVWDDRKNNWNAAFKEVAKTIFNIVNKPGYKPPPPPPPEWDPAEKVDIARLPMTGSKLFGRKNELELLDSAWESGDNHVISLVTWGGVGKSTLVNKWLETMASDNYRGAVYAE